MSISEVYRDVGYFPSALLCKQGSYYNHFIKRNYNTYKNDLQIETKRNVCSLIPIVNIIIGIGRLCRVSEEKDNAKKAVKIIRGVCDILFLSYVFVFIDIIVTIGRIIKANQHDPTAPSPILEDALNVVIVHDNQ